MILNENNGKTLVSSIAQDLPKALINHQLLIVASNRKLYFYNSFKRDTNRTEFLDAIKNLLHRSSINKFRLGNHRLCIGTGRYTVPKPPEHLRICSLCQANEVENECDVMFSCTLYDTLRNKFFDEIITKYNFFNDLDVKSKILFLPYLFDLPPWALIKLLDFESGRLFEAGAYSKWALIRGWALIKFSTFSAGVVRLCCNKTINGNNKTQRCTKARFL